MLVPLKSYYCDLLRVLLNRNNFSYLDCDFNDFVLLSKNLYIFHKLYWYFNIFLTSGNFLYWYKYKRWKCKGFKYQNLKNVINSLQYFTSIEKIRDRQEQDKVTKSTSKSLSAIEEFCEKFDRSVRQNIIKVTHLYNTNVN